jgi:hypothetical protein
MFSVVKFYSDGSVQCVPTNWITPDKLYCLWPSGPNKNIAALIAKSSKPGNSWESIRIKIFKTCGKLIILINYFLS